MKMNASIIVENSPLEIFIKYNKISNSMIDDRYK